MVVNWSRMDEASEVLAVMREGELPEAQEAEQLDRLPIIDQLRLEVNSIDRDWLEPLLANSDDRLAGLAVSMLRHHLCDPALRSKLESHWFGSDYLKGRIMWGLLSQPDLSEAWHNLLRRFVLSDWQNFHDFNDRFYGQSESGLQNLMKRLNDPAAIPSKRWVYLYSIPVVVKDIAEARSLINATVDSFPELCLAGSELLDHLEKI